MQQRLLLTSDVARRLGVTPAAIRALERRGRIHAAVTTEKGMRLYAIAEVERVIAERTARRDAKGHR